MSKLRVHELARELGRQNKEVIEFLKSKGIDVKSHMSMVDELAISIVKDRFKKNNNRGKEHIAKLDTPKTEEKVVTAKSEGDKTETPKKKKNIIRVFHAQNASDGGKTRKKPVKAEAREQVHQEMQKEQRLLTIQEQMVTDQEEIMTVPMPVTEDRRETETVREDLRAKAELRAMEIVRADVLVREEPRVMVSAREDHREMETVRVDVSVREDHRAITVRVEDHRVMARVARMETEVKDAMDASAAVRDVRDSARIPERMMIWYLHRN